jgi:hypothetical protein
MKVNLKQKVKKKKKGRRAQTADHVPICIVCSVQSFMCIVHNAWVSLIRIRERMLLPCYCVPKCIYSVCQCLVFLIGNTRVKLAAALGGGRGQSASHYKEEWPEPVL